MRWSVVASPGSVGSRTLLAQPRDRPQRLVEAAHGALDLPELAAFFIGRYNTEMKRAVNRVTPEALALLTRYPWPGNVRELRNVIERACVLCRGESINLDDALMEDTKAEVWVKS